MKNKTTAVWRWMRPCLAAMAAVTLLLVSPASRAEGVVAPQGTSSTSTVFRILPAPNSDEPGWSGPTPEDVCGQWVAYVSAIPGGWRDLPGPFTPETVPWAFCGVRQPGSQGYLDSNQIQVPLCPGDANLQWYTPPGSTAPPLPYCVCKAGTGPHASGNGSAPDQCLPVTDVQQTHQRCPDCETHFGKPIFPLTGAERLTLATGLRIGHEPLVFTYDSARTPPQAPASDPLLAAATFTSPEPTTLGANWLSSLHRRLVAQRDAHTVKVTRGDGKVSSFVKSPSAAMVAEPGSRDTLRQPAFWRFIDGTRSVVEEYESDGDDNEAKLARLYTLDGHWLRFEYSSAAVDPARAPGAGYLLAVQDRFGRRIEFSYTGALLGRVTDVAGQNLALSYDAQGRLAQVGWADGTSERFVYEDGTSPQALTGWIDAKGVRYASIGYDGQGRATSTELAGGVARYSVSYDSAPVVTVAQSYDAWNNELKRTWSWQAPQGTRVSLPNGSSTGIASGNVNGYPRTGGQSQAAGSGSGASSRTVVHDANGNVASEVGFNGQQSCYVNDAARSVETVRVEGLQATQQGAQDCAAVTAANASLPAGAVKTSSFWHPDWNLRSAVAEPGRITTSVYNGQRDPFAGNGFAQCTPPGTLLRDLGPIVVLCKEVVQATTDANGHLGFGAALQPGAIDTVRTWTYDEYGQVLTASTGSGTSQYLRAPATTADYTQGDLLRITAPNGEVTTFDRYDKYGQVLQSTRDGVVTTYTYDLRQRMLSRTVGTKTTAYAYDAIGQLTKVTLPDGSWVGYEYDDAHRAVAVTDIKGNRIDYVLDNAGNRIDQRLKDPAGELTQSLNELMDALGREQQAGVTDQAPASNAFPPLPNSPLPLERYEYDAQGNRTKITRGAGTLNLQTRLSYDALERVKEATDAKNGSTRFEYDGGDRTTQVTDPRNLVTQYPRNGLGDATQVISPDTGTENLSYDAARNLKTRTDSRGVLTTYGYDASDRLTGAVYTQAGQPTEAVTLAYSQTGAGFSYGMGRLTSSSYPGGSAQYGYDDQGEVVNDVQRVEASTGSNTTQLTQTVGYGYTLGNLSGIGYPSGRQLGLSWVDGEVTGITLGGTPLITQIEWTPFAGAVKRWRWAMATGIKANERYFDLAGRAIRYPLGDALRDLRYDEASRIVSFTHLSADGTAQPGLDQAFGYDENDRITSITTNAASWAITYDPNGNRTGLSLNGSLSAYTVEATSNRVTGTTNPARSFGYDSAGNTTQDSSGYTATYNLRGQLATLTKNGVTTRYTYNAAGQRVRKVSSTGPDSTVVFVYDQAGHLLGEYDRNGAALREYVWLRDTPMAMFTPDPSNPSGEPLVYFIHSDHLNTPRVVVDRNNQVRWRWLAEPFGTSAPETNPSGLGVFTQNLRFPGQYADAESGLFYNYHRYYAAEGGQYTQSDPIGLAGGSLTTYGYVGGNPLRNVDPSGLDPWYREKQPQPPRFEPRLWNDQGQIQLSNNCYSYAADRPYGHKFGTKPQPGDESGHPLTDLTCDDITRAAKSDGFVGKHGSCPVGYHEVSLVIAPDVDYHWYRKDTSGRWSHKPGHTAATDVDASGKPILDPNRANRDYSDRGGPNYSQMCPQLCAPDR